MSEPRDEADENEQQAARLRLEAERIREGRAATVERAAREAVAAVAAGDVLEAAEVLLWASRALRSSIRAPGSLEESAAGLEGLARRQRETRLRADDTHATVAPMDINMPIKSVSVRKAVGRARRKHPAQMAFYRKGKTIADVAAEIKEGRPRVFSWMAEGAANRAIPRHHAVYLKQHYGVPISAWRRIAD